jgi:hypothetical protein
MTVRCYASDPIYVLARLLAGWQWRLLLFGQSNCAME